MFFLGTHIDPSRETAMCAVIRKELKNIRNHYLLADLQQIPLNSLPQTLGDMYRRPALIVKKRVFSQDRRPKKEVSAHPRIVLCGSDGINDIAAALRSKGLPVESVLLTRADEVIVDEPSRAGAGTDYHVPEDRLWKILADVVEQGRVGVEKKEAHSNPLMQAVNPALAKRENLCNIGADNDSRCPLLAVAAPLWFRETIRYAQAYRASATSKRRFI